MDKILRDGIQIYLEIDGERFFGCASLADGAYTLTILVNDEERTMRVVEGNLLVTEEVDEDGNNLVKLLQPE